MDLAHLDRDRDRQPYGKKSGTYSQNTEARPQGKSDAKHQARPEAKPQGRAPSHIAKSAKYSGAVHLFTNQYNVQIKAGFNVFNYPTQIEDLPLNDPHIETQVKEAARGMLDTLFGPHGFKGLELFARKHVPSLNIDGNLFPFDPAVGYRRLYTSMGDDEIDDTTARNNEECGGKEFRILAKTCQKECHTKFWGWVDRKYVAVVYYDGKRYLFWVKVEKSGCFEFGKHAGGAPTPKKAIKSSPFSDTLNTSGSSTASEINIQNHFNEADLKRHILPLLSSLFSDSFRRHSMV